MGSKFTLAAGSQYRPQAVEVKRAIQSTYVSNFNW